MGCDCDCCAGTRSCGAAVEVPRRLAAQAVDFLEAVNLRIPPSSGPYRWAARTSFGGRLAAVVDAIASVQH